MTNKHSRKTDHLIIERLEFQGYCGVSEPERDAPQPMAVDLELFLDMAPAAATDELARTVDYTQVVERVTAITQTEQFCLLETLAERLAQALLSEFSVIKVGLWVRKLKPPMKGVRESVGVRITRQRHSILSDPTSDCPADWLVEHRRLLTPGRALDLACGRGRNAIYLAQEGFRVEAWDRDTEALEVLRAKAQSLELSTIAIRLVDLEREPEIPAALMDLIIVFNYLQRDVIPQIKHALKPGGLLIYETFLLDNYERFNHPRRREFCLGRNELLTLFGGLRVLAYREGASDPQRGPYTASLVAQQP